MTLDVGLLEQASKAAVDAIVRDLSDRRGLKSEWNQIDEDIQEEIRHEWRQIIEAAIVSKAAP